MTELILYKMKVCLIGECAVGKTSLIRRFVFNMYDEKYIATIGTTVTKRKLMIQNPKNDELLDIHLLIWDIIGDQDYRQLVRQTYFQGALGIIGVCDITRKNTLSELHNWVEAAQSTTEGTPIVFLGNKCDLADEQQVDLNDIKSFASGYEKSTAYLSSAKTGFNVELAFRTLGEKILEDMF